MKISDLNKDDIIWTDDEQSLNQIVDVLNSNRSHEISGVSEAGLLLSGFDDDCDSDNFSILRESQFQDHFLRKANECELIFFRALKAYVYSLCPKANGGSMNIRCNYYLGDLTSIEVGFLIEANLKLPCHLVFESEIFSGMSEVLGKNVVEKYFQHQGVLKQSRSGIK